MAPAAAITVIALVLTPIFVVNAFRVLGNDWFVRYELGRDGFPPDRYGLSAGERLDLALTGLRSIQPGSRGIVLLERATLPDGLPAFDRRELRHMADVRRLLGVAYVAQLITVVLLAVATLVSRRSPRWRTIVPRGLLIGSLATLVVAALAVPAILLGFDDFFLGFHEIFFTGETWRFSRTDTLLRIYPEVFWQDVAVLAAGMVVAQAVVVALGYGLVAASAPGGAGRDRTVIRLEREHAGPLRIGHRGAATLAPENTLRSFRAAVEVGVDLIEFDVLDLRRGPLVLAHSDHLLEVSHGAASGRVRGLSLEALREYAPELPTLDEALAFFVDEASEVGLHVDLKLRTRIDELGAAIRRHGLEARTVVSGVHVPSLHAMARSAPRVRIGITYPEDRLSISRKPYLWPMVSLGLASMRASVPLRLPRLARRAGASAVMLQHRLVTESSVARAHAVGLPVLAWTVDEIADLNRVVAAGVDGVITNDPRIFVATLKA